MQNGIFQNMGKDAVKELSQSNWREVSPNVIIMALFYLLTNHLAHKFMRPMWAFVGIIGTGLGWWVVKGIIEMVGG